MIQAIAFLAIPFFLMCAEGEILPSISHYAHYQPMLFAELLTLAGALFLYDGYVNPSRRYNLICAAGLFGLILFPNMDYDYPHYAFASLFFFGSMFNMVYFSSKEDRKYSIAIATVVLIGLAGSFLFNWYSIFWAEWIGMVPISVHFVLEAKGKID